MRFTIFSIIFSTLLSMSVSHAGSTGPAANQMAREYLSEKYQNTKITTGSARSLSVKEKGELDHSLFSRPNVIIYEVPYSVSYNEYPGQGYIGSLFYILQEDGLTVIYKDSSSSASVFDGKNK